MISEVDLKDWEMIGQYEVKDMPDNSVFSLVRDYPSAFFTKVYTDAVTTFAKGFKGVSENTEMYFSNSALGFLWQKK